MSYAASYTVFFTCRKFCDSSWVAFSQHPFLFPELRELGELRELLSSLLFRSFRPYFQHCCWRASRKVLLSVSSQGSSDHPPSKLLWYANLLRVVLSLHPPWCWGSCHRRRVACTSGRRRGFLFGRVLEERVPPHLRPWKTGCQLRNASWKSQADVSCKCCCVDILVPKYRCFWSGRLAWRFFRSWCTGGV